MSLAHLISVLESGKPLRYSLQQPRVVLFAGGVKPVIENAKSRRYYPPARCAT